MLKIKGTVFMLRRLLAAVFAASSLAAPASAAPLIFTDRATFQAATGVLSGFAGFNDVRPGQATQVYTGFSFSETNGFDNSAHADDTFPAATTEGSGAIWYLVSDNFSGTNSLGVFTFGPSITAFGLDVTADRLGSLIISGFGGSHSATATPFKPQFFGVINTDGFSSVTFDLKASGFAPGLGFDALAFGTVAAVPEPASWALIILGFGVIGLALRLERSRAKTVSAMA